METLRDRIQAAKDKQYRMLERFHVGDCVYPFWLQNFIVYGVVIDIDTVARKVICDFNGVRRQFCPEDLMHVNPELARAASREKSRKASGKSEVADPEDHVGNPWQDDDNGVTMACPDCGKEMSVAYNEHTAKTDFVCTKCGRRDPEDTLPKSSKDGLWAQSFLYRESKGREARIARRIMKGI